MTGLVAQWDELKDNLPLNHAEAAGLLFDHGDKLADRITALEAQVAAADRLAGFAQGVVDRWDSQDWRSGHTLDFITAQRNALAAYRAAKGE